jgi:hypothetical protein
VGTEPVDYCREIETYLCRKNDGHLIRVVGPSFELVSGWAADGIPLKVAFAGIDRYFERYYRKGPRRRPVKIDFCDADVRDVFDEWRRAVGLTASDAGEARPKGPSLPEHLERALTRLSSARATGVVGAEADAVLDRVSAALDAARASSRGLRGDARRALIERLSALDRELLQIARAGCDHRVRAALEDEAAEELSAFRERMAPEAYARARENAIDRLLRERLGLPLLAFD